MEVSKDRVTFFGKSINTGETVSGWYWENRGDGYIITRDEGIQPPLFRTHAVERDTVVARIDYNYEITM